MTSENLPIEVSLSEQAYVATRFSVNFEQE